MSVGQMQAELISSPLASRLESIDVSVHSLLFSISTFWCLLGAGNEQVLTLPCQDPAYYFMLNGNEATCIARYARPV